MYGRFDYYGIPDIDREMALEEASTRYELVYQTGGTGGPYPDETKAKAAAERLLKGGQDRWIAVIDAKHVNDLKKAKVLWLLKRGGSWEKGPRPMPNVPPTTQYKESSDRMDEARSSASGAEKLWKELRSKKGGAARSAPVKGKPGKYKYQGKVGVWRTLENGDRVFFPDDKSGPLAMRGPTRAKGKKPGLLKRIGGAIKRALTREDIETELAALESTSSPFPEVRSRRIEELRAELEEGKGLKPGDMNPGAKIVNKKNPEWGEWKVKRQSADGAWEIQGRRGTKELEQGELHFWKLAEDIEEANGRGMRRGKPEGGRGMGPGKGKCPHRGNGNGDKNGMGMGTGACACKGLRAQVDEATTIPDQVMSQLRSEFPGWSQKDVEWAIGRRPSRKTPTKEAQDIKRRYLELKKVKG